MRQDLKRKLIFGVWRVVPRHIINPFIMEMKSSVGRRLIKRLKLSTQEEVLLNFGCGEVPLKGFINVDFYSFFGNSSLSYQADFRYPLKIDSNVADGIFTEHMVEHLSYEEASHFFHECYRIMKKDAVIRIVVPDVEKYIKAYINPTAYTEFFLNEAPGTTTPMEALSDITQNWSHRSAWDFNTMSIYLRRAGFTDVMLCSYGHGSNSKLLVDLEARKGQSLYVEAIRDGR